MNSEIIINVQDVCGNNIYTRSDGSILYKKIKESLDSYDKVVVEFNEREISSESFLDEAVVEHYLQPFFPGSEQKIVLRGVTSPDQMLLRRIYEYRKRLKIKQSKKSIIKK